jgi:hypothetical protein
MFLKSKLSIVFFLLLIILYPSLIFAQTKVNPDSIPFASAVNYGAGDGPSSIFCADLDGDTDLDLVVANYWSDNVSILKNNGDGIFQPKVDYAAGDGPFSVFCADLDGDGYLDMAVADWYSTNISILKNKGDGTFQSPVSYGAGYSPFSVFCADLDGDTDLDLAVANWYSDNVSVLKNNGDGTFQISVDYGAGDGSLSVFCADLDRDGDLDLAVANYNSDNVSILLNRTIIVNVEDEEDIDQLPKQFSLSQNYPNPFNQSTKIEFAMVNSGFISLEIYDILGRKVRALVSENLSAGYKSVLWDGKDNSGKEVASGIYFYQLKVENFSEARKLVLLK